MVTFLKTNTSEHVFFQNVQNNTNVRKPDPTFSLVEKTLDFL